MRTNKLAARTVATATVGKHGDGGGLWLRVRANGSRAWVFRFTFRGQSREMGLGSVDSVSLAKARTRAQAARELVADGRDPIEARSAHKACPTFREVAEKFIQRRKGGWDARNLRQWESSLEAHVYPYLGNVTVDQIAESEVVTCLDSVWLTKPRTGKRLAVRIRRILDAAKAEGFRTGPNPATASSVRALFGDVPTPTSFSSMPWEDVPAFVDVLQQQQGIVARCLELIVLTCVRSTEARLARWGEFDLDAGVWEIPAARMKTRKKNPQPHRVPLAPEVVELLRALPQESEWVFPSPYDSRRPLGESAVLRQLRTFEDVAAVHGFRSSFRTWSTEEMQFNGLACELVLAHSLPKDLKAYLRSDLFDERVRIMAAWAAYCYGTAAAAEVVPIREGVSG